MNKLLLILAALTISGCHRLDNNQLERAAQLCAQHDGIYQIREIGTKNIRVLCTDGYWFPLIMIKELRSHEYTD